MRNIANNNNTPCSRARGFSLIEVTISIAITAVALVSLMGMLPQGMKLMREAGDRAVETRIHQGILSELMLVNWKDLPRHDYRVSKEVKFYDDQGIQIFRDGPDAMAGEEFDLSHVYTARVSVPADQDQLPMSISGRSYTGVHISAGPTISLANTNLQLVIVEITNVVDEAFYEPSGFDDNRFLKTIRTFQATLARMGNNF